MAAAIPKDLRSFFFDLMATAKTAADSLAVMKELANRGIDLIEISGGSYEHPKMMEDGQGATFIDYARQAKAAVDVPIMVTGGFRTREGIEEAVASGDTDLVRRSPVGISARFATPALSRYSSASAGSPFFDGVAPIRSQGGVVSWLGLL